MEKLSTRLGGSSFDPTRQRESSAVMADDGCRTPATPLREGIQQWLKIKNTETSPEERKERNGKAPLFIACPER